MATVKAGDEMCVRWPAKNHAVPDEDDRGVFINMPSEVTAKDPNQSQFMKMNIAKLKYKNCNHINGDSDHTPCGGCFRIPEDRKTGTYVIQWRWELNDDEWYTSCWDLRVEGLAPPPPPVTTQPPTDPVRPPANETAPEEDHKVVPLGGSTSIFAELADWE